MPGGYVDAGEDPRLAAAREAEEEAGITVEVGNVVEVFANPPDEGGALFLLYAARWVDGEPKPGDDADDAGFFRRDELPELAFGSTAAAIARWQPEDPPGPQADRRALAVAHYNAAWELIDLPERSGEQVRDMLALACASRALWADIGTEENAVIADWLVAHAASLAGFGQKFEIRKGSADHEKGIAFLHCLL